MQEQSKAAKRRFHNGHFHLTYFVGRGIDVGAGDDCLSINRHVFSRIGDVVRWDQEDGDAQTLPGIEANSFDFLHSSHCLEHLHNPYEALARWTQVVRPGGHLIVTVPDWHLYEHQHWPSRFNYDHKWIFTSQPIAHERCVSVLDLAKSVDHLAHLIKLELIEDFYNTSLGTEVDQTLLPNAECAWEIVLRRLQ